MQTAQRIIKKYRRNRFIVCTICALTTLILTLCVRFMSERNFNHHRTVSFASHAVSALDDVLRPLNSGRDVMLPLIGLPCSVTHLALRKQAAKLQTVRSIGLVQGGVLYCSSILAIAMCRSVKCMQTFRRQNRYCFSPSIARLSRAVLFLSSGIRHPPVAKMG